MSGRKKAAKAVLLLLLMVGLALLTTGCNGNYELQNELIIEAIGIDRKDGRICLCVQTLNTEQYPSGEGNSSGGQITTTYQVDGETVEEALNKLTVMSGKNPVYTHNRLILIGESVYRDGCVLDHVDFLSRSCQPRATVLIAASEKDAKSVISADPGEGKLSAKIMEDILQAGGRNGQCAPVELYRYLNLAKRAGECEYMPLIGVEDTENKQEKQLADRGLLVTFGGRALTTLTQEETRTLLLMTERLRGGSISGSNNGTPFSLDVVSSRPTVRTAVDGGKLHIAVTLSCVCDISEYENRGGQMDLSEPDSTAKAAEQTLEQAIGALLQKTVVEKKADIFGFFTRTFQRETAFFRRNIDRQDSVQTGLAWRELLPSVDYTVRAQVHLRRSGQELVQ